MRENTINWNFLLGGISNSFIFTLNLLRLRILVYYKEYEVYVQCTTTSSYKSFFSIQPFLYSSISVSVCVRLQCVLHEMLLDHTVNEQFPTFFWFFSPFDWKLQSGMTTTWNYEDRMYQINSNNELHETYEVFLSVYSVQYTSVNKKMVRNNVKWIERNDRNFFHSFCSPLNTIVLRN